MADESRRTSLACSIRLVESLTTGEALSTPKQRSCDLRSSRDGRGIKEEREDEYLQREKQSETNKV